MALPLPIAGALISGGGQIGGGIIGAVSSAIQNKKAREFAERQYAQQRRDALMDWNMQNEYNSPAAQMQRLKLAGLNPNLVYGHGADATSGPVRSSSPQSWSPQSLGLESIGEAPSSAFQTYQNTQLQQQTLNNMQATELSTIVDTQKKAAEINKILVDTDVSKTRDLQLKESTKNLTIINQNLQAKIDAEIARIKAGIKLTESQIPQVQASTALTRQQLAALKQQMSIAKEVNDRARQQFPLDQAIKQGIITKNREEVRAIAQQILYTEVQTAKTDQERLNLLESFKKLEDEAIMAELDRRLKAKGIQPGDAAPFRLLMEAMEEAGIIAPDPDVKKYAGPGEGK